MLKKFSNPTSPFAMYFKEAPGDENDNVSVTVAPRKNRGTDYDNDTNTVTVGPRTNRGADYAQDDPEPEAEPQQIEEPTTTTTQEETPAEPDVGDDEGTDYSADGDAEDNPEEGDDQGAPAGGEGDEGEDGDAPDEPNTGGEDATDYSADGDAEGEDAPADDSGTGENNEQTEEEKVEANKKYHMYKRFMHLYNLLEVFIDKCRNIVKPDAAQNAVIKTVANNLTDLYDNLFDYMTIKYKSATYIQVLLYFETAISVIQLNFELLKNNKINLKQ